MKTFKFRLRRKQQETTPTPHDLYKELSSDTYEQYPYELRSLDEEMFIVNQVIDGYWKPRFLMDARSKTAFEFMNAHEVLQTIGTDDIDWDSLKHLPEYAVATAKALDAHYPTIIHAYDNGLAQVSWTLNPDGRYYMDEDGFGMTDDIEIRLIGTIDRTGKATDKFRYEQP